MLDVSNAGGHSTRRVLNSWDERISNRMTGIWRRLRGVSWLMPNVWLPMSKVYASPLNFYGNVGCLQIPVLVLRLIS